MMKLIKITAIVVIMVLNEMAIKAIDPVKESPASISVFDEGSLKFSLSRPLDIELGSYKYDGEKQSNFTNINLRGMGTYFVKKGIGVGGGISIDRERDKNENGYSYTDSEVLFSLHGVYGTQVGNINSYVQPSIGFGRYTSEDKYDNVSNEYKEGIFRASLKVGALLPIGENTNTFFSPHVGWRYTKYTDSDNSSNFTTSSKLFIGGGITVAIPTRDIPCDCNTDFADVTERFSEGRNILEYSNKFRLSGYSYKEEYDNDFGESYADEDSETNFKLNIAYKRAIANRLFVGGFLNTDFEKYDYEENPEYTNNYSQILIGPAVEYHPLEDIKLENFFVEALIGVGSSKSTYKEGSTTTEYSYSRLTFDLSAAYDYGITSNISVVPRIGYEIGQSKNKDTDVKSSTSNIYLGFSTRINFASF